MLTHFAPLGTPFTLRCILCDAGDGLDSEAEAIAAGWRDIDYDDGLSWNFLGTCPDCAPAWYGELDL